ncbi:MAG: phosphotransferase [Caldilineaceae bacterium]|nr:phosphotransferase [Caldilineaceae bacterium]
MAPLHPTMLWEATDPQAALLKRFRFASSAEAGAWLVTVLADVYGIEVVTVDRLVISAYNLLAWLTTTKVLPLAETIATSARRCKRQGGVPSLLIGIETLLRWVEQHPLPTLTTQLIHHDYRAANILWHAGKIAAVLDFDDVCWGYRVNDLAWSAVHLGTRYHHWGPVSAAVHDTFLAAYTSQHPLTGVEQAWLPRLLLWHSINLAGSAVGGENFEAAVESVVTYTCRLDSPDGI